MQKHFKFVLLFLFAVFLLWFFGRNLDWQLVRESLSRANSLYIILSVFIICIGYLLRAVRWQVLLAPITSSSLRELFATTTVGFAAIFLVGRAGEIVRPMWLPMRDRRIRPSAALVTLGLERIFDLAALVWFFALNLIWFEPPIGREREFEYIEVVGFAMLGGVIAAFIGLAIYQRKHSAVVRFLLRLTASQWFPRRLRRVILSIMEKLAGALAIMKDPRELFMVSFWTLLLWAAIAVPTWLVLLAF
ncbi:MAG: hypothetical protein C4325_06750, partial [Blastocatellia bacterium]